MAFSHTYDTATPAGSDDPAEADDRMREIKLAIQERLNVEHVFDLTGTEVSHANTGKHTDITTLSIVNAGTLANAGNFTLNTDKFTIDAATGNVVVAGTLGVTGVATVAKGSLLASTDAPTTDAMIANKKYVDDQIAAYIASEVTLSAYTNEDYDGNAMLKSHAYKAQTGGFVTAYVTNQNGKTLSGYVGLTNDPVGAGVCLQQDGDTEGSWRVSISFLVAEGEYFEITYNGTNTPTILWKSMGTLSKPVDQD